MVFAAAATMLCYASMLIGSIENRKMARVGKMFQSRRTTVWFLIFAVVVAKAPPSLAYT